MEIYTTYYLHLHTVWKSNDKKTFTETLQKGFSSVDNPYKLALVCIKLCPDLFKSKNNGMAVSVAVELQSFLNKHGSLHLTHLTEDMQIEVFHIATKQKNIGLMRLLVTTFGLFDMREKLIPNLHAMVGQQQYKEVCTLATLLNLQEHFSTEELLVPLFCSDRLCLADEFLHSSPSHQKEIVIFIDNVIGKEPAALDILKKFNITDVKSFKSSKILSNTLARLLKRFNLDMSICPHLYNRRAVGGLRYLFYKHYIENGLQTSAFHSLVEDSLKETPDLKETLLDLFIEYCDPASAVPYVYKYQMDLENVPYMIKDAVLAAPSPLEMESSNNIAAAAQQQEEEWWDDCEDGSYELSIPQENITFIDSVPEFEKCLEVIFNSPVIGLDNEWKPTFGIGSGEHISLMQIATLNKIFLIDILTLQHHLEEHHWKRLGNLFSNASITKLGYGIKGDFRVLVKLHEELKKALASPKNVIDLDVKKAPLLESCPDIFSYKTSTYKGLSDLVYRCFGKPLNKNEQFSNWSNRPLTRLQKLYAALDAWCLIDIYNYLNTKAQELGINDWQNIRLKTQDHKSKSGKKSQKKEPSPNKMTVSERRQGPMTAKDFRVVCDTMLQGLAKKLRLCGIDAVALENGQSCDDCIEFYEKEKRFVLSKGASYARLAKFVPADYVFHVENEGARQQLEEVMKFFKVKLSPNDFFARCTKCNSGSYFKAPPNIVRNIQENINSQGLSDDWRTFDGTKINLTTGVTEHGVKLKVEKLIGAVVEKAEELFVCTKCGRCYWEGSHQERAFKEIFTPFLSEGDSSQEEDNIFCFNSQSSNELPDLGESSVDRSLNANSSISKGPLDSTEKTLDAAFESDQLSSGESNLEKSLKEMHISH